MLALFSLAAATATVPLPACLSYVNMPAGDLANPPVPIATKTSDECAAACVANQACSLYTYVTSESSRCSLPDGCCWLKSHEVSGVAPTVWDPYACSAYIRVPKGEFPPEAAAESAAAAAHVQMDTVEELPAKKTKVKGTANKNVLYIVVDDLRPDLQAYGQNFTHNPAITKLAATGITFENAYCQISVCSPSRLSFMTGRRPDHAGFYNFINHFRQADCGISSANLQYDVAADYRTVNTDSYGGGCQWGGGNGACGGSGQCCSLCTEDSNCTHWSYTGNICHLKSGAPGALTAAEGTVSGKPGTYTHAKWTSNPQHFKDAGYLTLHTGKLFHTEEGGVGNKDPTLNGPGMPPNSDPISWSPNLAMGQVNAVANMFGTAADEIDGVNASRAGIFNSKPDVKTNQLADRVISSDAVVKLRLAAYNTATTGQPFFLATGFRKPHLAFRFPQPWLDELPPLEEIKVAEHPTLDESVPPIAHCDKPPQATPYTAVATTTAQKWRLHYYACIAWMDSQVGRVLDELDVLGHTNDTLIVFHADHGWSLGEHGEWQKFSNFEHGTRVPLIMRVPWLPQSAGTRSHVLAELIDVLPTMAALAGLTLPTDEIFDGKSLAPVIAQPNNNGVAEDLKPYAISQYMRCPSNDTDPEMYWKQNDCLFTDRVLIAFFGYSIRTANWRFTEWTKWNGTSLSPDHSAAGLVGVELYSHTPGSNGLSYSFNAFENKNEAEANPEVVKTLRTLLHGFIANQTRIASLTPPHQQ